LIYSPCNEPPIDVVETLLNDGFTVPNVPDGMGGLGTLDFSGYAYVLNMIVLLYNRYGLAYSYIHDNKQMYMSLVIV
jgi:hypothetical protein